MTLQNMFGVVLWSDTDAHKAVIWCEDQGELAYYTPSERSVHDAPSLDAGDLIQFDLIVQKNMRKATNPQLLEQSHSPDLPRNLKSTRTPRRTAGSRDTVVKIANYFTTSQRQQMLKIG